METGHPPTAKHNHFIINLHSFLHCTHYTPTSATKLHTHSTTTEQYNFNHTAEVARHSTFLLSSAELLTGAALLRDDDDVELTAAGGLAAAVAADGGLPTGRPADDGGLAAGLAAAAGCLAAATARGFSAAGGFSTVGFTAGVLVRSFFGDTGTGASTLSAGSATGCKDNAQLQYYQMQKNSQIYHFNI